MTTLEKIKEIMAEQALIDPSDIRADQTLDDIGLDSLGLVEAIFAIEETFDISVPFNANAPDGTGFDVSTVASISAAVDKLIAEQHG